MNTKKFDQPLRFVSGGDGGAQRDFKAEHTHIVLFHEDPEYANVITYSYIRAGLHRGERCAFVSEFPKCVVEREMRDNDIDVNGFVNKNQLQIFEFPNLFEHDGGPEKGLDVLAAHLCTGCSSPKERLDFDRVVIKCLFRPRNSAQLKKDMELESRHAAVFRHFSDTSLIVSFSVDDIETTIAGEKGVSSEWMTTLLEKYDAVIFARQFSKGLALYLD